MKKTLSMLMLILMMSTAHADDTHNRCSSPMPPSANVSPADDAVHLNSDGSYKFVYEQWYWNTVLLGFDGHGYGVETIVFQFAFGPVVIPVTQIAMTDLTTGEFHQQLVFGSHGYDFVPGGFDIDTQDFAGAFTAVGGKGNDDISMSFSDGAVATVSYRGLKNPSASFFDGFGNYLDVATGHSHGSQYYLQRRSMAAFGSVTVHGHHVPVVGTGWYDRQWGTVIGTPGSQADNTYWKWFALHLSDDTEYMLWDMYAVDTNHSLIHVANRMGAAPACREATLTNFTVTGLGSFVSNAGPPPSTFDLANHISIPSEGLEIDVRAPVPTQIIMSGGLFSPFHEGAVTVTGRKNGKPIVGVGYYEQFVSPGGCCQGI